MLQRIELLNIRFCQCEECGIEVFEDSEWRIGGLSLAIWPCNIHVHAAGEVTSHDFPRTQVDMYADLLP